MAQQVPVSADARIDPGDSKRNDGTVEIATDLAYQRIVLVNVMFFGRPGAGDRQWLLIDAGVFGSKSTIKNAAAKRFGEQARPSAIVLTHGHFDHVGVLEDLAAEWDAPVYAHPQEHPHLDGRQPYPKPDPTVGGGLLALLSPLFPIKPVNVGARLRALPEDGSVPGMPGWRWIATPGHSAGHVSLWRESDRILIAGDAFVTTAQESVYSVALQKQELHGPPKYLTPDWASAKTSVQKLAALSPEVVVTGHGGAMQGAAMRDALETLARDFDTVAVPKKAKPAAA